MPPPSKKKVLCTNCETEELKACELGDDTIYRCVGASESEIENRSGCGVWVSFKEYKEMKEAIQQKDGGKTNNKQTVPMVTKPSNVTLNRPAIGGIRRPLGSLHSNTIHNRTPLHAKPSQDTVALAPSSTPPLSASSKSSDSSVPSSGSTIPSKPIPSNPPASSPPASKKDDSNDDDEDEDEEDESEGESSPEPAKPAPRGKGVVTSTSTTPTKIPSAASSPARTPKRAKREAASEKPVAFNLADHNVSSADRMRALRAKLAKQREQSLAEFREKYGEEGDEETEEERATAQRKRSGEAGEEFMASQGEVERAPMIGSLSIKGAEDPLAVGYRRPFTTPRTFGSMSSEAKSLIAERQKSMHVGRRLGARLRIFSGAFLGFKPLDSTMEGEEEGEPTAPPPPVTLTKAEELKAQPDGFQPLIIWQPTPDELKENPKLTTIEVPMIVCKWLRPHQREGVKFMCECVLGQRNLGEQPPPTIKTITNADGSTTTITVPPSLNSLGGGAILADDMGLGKTLQSVALLYTLLSQGFETGSPVAHKVIVVTPTSLVSNWQNEIDKWLGKGKVTSAALSEVGKEKIECGIDSFVERRSKVHVLIISYDTFRRNVNRLNKPGLCDLLICDEAHRLKNNKTSTYVALDSLPCKRRVLLSGTPMQNDLSEFFSMINFTNRNILGDRKCFRKYYELPILLGREPDCLESDAVEGSERASELSAIVNQFVLRRTNVLLRQHLPPKVIQVVCCRPSELQIRLYQHFLKSKSVKKLASGEAEEGGRASGGLQALPLITSLKKLCNHPKLIWDTAQNANSGAAKKGVLNEETGQIEKIAPALLGLFKGLMPLFSQYDGGAFLKNPNDARYSGKMFVLERLLTQIRISNSGDRIVIVSNFTSALDVIAHMCTQKKWDHLRLDGSTSIKNRQKLVDQLSDHRGNKVFVFLLSSRAGGCGLNLIGANRLILFDPDWNPAVDKQAAARVWRDGQTKRCFVYRFLTTGSIEEKVYQRQLSKEGLSGVLGGSTADASLTKDELRDLFTLDDSQIEQPSDTHKGLECDCLDKYQIRTEAEANKAEEQSKREAEEQVKRVLEAEAEEKKHREDEGDTDEVMEQKDNGSPAPPPVDDDTKMEDVNEPGAPEVGEGEEGDGEGGDKSSSSSDEEMNDFIANDDDDDSGGEDYGSKKKSGGKKKPSKKDGPRKMRKKRSAVGSLNFPQLHGLATCTMGQRGEPPEEELINWAHHATSNSIPDPIFRAATRTMPYTRGDLPFVSFVFSCEVSGKAIQNSTDAKDALAVSSMCTEAPTTVQASKPITVSLDVALAKHAEFMAHERRKALKRMGNDDTTIEERIADPSKRRHSSRQSKPVLPNPDTDEPNQDDLDFIVPDGDDGEEEGGDGAEGQPSRKRKAADPDAASAALIAKMLQEDAGLVRKGRQPKAKAAPKTKKKKDEPDEDAMQDIAEGEEGNDEPEGEDEKEDDDSSVQTASPAKKRKTDTGAVADEHTPPNNAVFANSPQKSQLNQSSKKVSSTPSSLSQLKAPATTKISAPKPQDPDEDEGDFMEDDDDDSDIQVIGATIAPTKSQTQKPQQAKQTIKSTPTKAPTKPSQSSPQKKASPAKKPVAKPPVHAVDDGDDFMED